MTVKNEALPSTWTWATLGEIGYWYGGGTPAKSTKEYWNSPDIPWATPKDMKTEDIHQTELSVSNTAIKETNLSRILEGSLLMVTRSGILSRTFPVAVTHCSTTINQDIKALSPHAGVVSKYIALVCRHMEQRILTICSKQGTTVSSINTSSLQAFRIPLASSKEQHRIVAKIEELFSEIDSGVESLRIAQAKLKTARQSLLKAAFEGKLTEQWRQDNANQLENPEALLARSQAEREAHYQRQLTDWQQQVNDWEAAGKEGKKPRKPKAPKALPPLTQQELAELPELPEGWQWLSLGNLSEISGGITKNQKRNTLPQKHPFLRVANVYANELKLDEIHTIGATVEELEKTKLIKGDLLIVEGNGSPDQIGRVAKWDGTVENCTHQNHLIRARLTEVLNSDFALYFLLSSTGRQAIKKVASSTSGLYTLSLSKIEKLCMPICSHSEQVKIVEQLDTRLSQIERLENTLVTSLKQAEALKQSILKRAFTGRLVPQDPDDEPASELLARIRAERESQVSANPKRRARNIEKTVS